MGFEPTRGDPNGLAVHRLNHSATSSGSTCNADTIIKVLIYLYERKRSKLKIILIDEDGIRTHAGRPQWISSPSP